MSDIEVYQPPAQLEPYQAALAMTPEQAKALDDQVRLCTQAVLREGTDYGIIPGTNGEKTLWRPGAQKLLQWFGLAFTCDRVEVERDDEGRKHGITYRAAVGRLRADGSFGIIATCEGTADYDESKFYQPVEQVKARLREQEHKWAAKDRRVPNADRWNSAKEYRADWNALMKRAQKRAIVGAVVDATAAGGIFSDREEDDAPVPQHDGPSWYEQALEAALTFTTTQAGSKLYTEAAQAARDGLCTPRQKDHIQNRVRQRLQLLQTATPADAENLGRAPADASPAAAAPAGQPAASQPPMGAPAAGEATPPRPGGEEITAPVSGDTARPGTADGADATGPGAAATDMPENAPGSVGEGQLTRLHTLFTKLGFGGDEREQKLAIAETITGRKPLTGPKRGRSSGNLSWTEAATLIDTLDGFRSRDALIAYMAQRGQDSSDD